MRKNFGAKAILYPMPVLIIGTYDENGKPNAMNMDIIREYRKLNNVVGMVFSDGIKLK